MSKFHAAILIVPAAIALAGFPQETKRAEPVAPLEQTVAEPLRVQIDLARGRRWELHWDAVLAYDMASGELVRAIHLPGVIFAGARESCLPDMLLARNGALVVSSNTQTRLWRISPARFEVEAYDIELESGIDQDIGFANLSWGRNEGILFAESSPARASWKIDLSTGSATKLDSSAAMRGGC